MAEAATCPLEGERMPESCRPHVARDPIQGVSALPSVTIHASTPQTLPGLVFSLEEPHTGHRHPY